MTPPRPRGGDDQAALPRLLTVKEYAAWYRVTPRTVYQWVAEGAVPVVRVGRLVRIVVPSIGDDEEGGR